MVASDGGGTSNGIAEPPQDEFREGGRANNASVERRAMRFKAGERYAETAEDSLRMVGC